MRTRHSVCIAVVSFLLSTTAYAQRLTWEQEENRRLDEIVALIQSARGTPEEAVTLQQYGAALSNIASASRMPKAIRHRALALLRQHQATGDFQRSSIRWDGTGDDGSGITCIVSPTTTQIIWKGKHAEMNPSTRRWRRYCVASSPVGTRLVNLRIDQAKANIERRLRDPEGARYRNVRLMTNGVEVALCGSLNARNGFGGYGGYSRFITTPTFVAMDDGENGLWAVVGRWDDFCTGKEGYRDAGPISFR